MTAKRNREFVRRLQQALDASPFEGQKDLAVGMKIREGTVSGWFNGTMPRGDNLLRLTAILRVSPDWLLRNVGMMRGSREAQRLALVRDIASGEVDDTLIERWSAELPTRSAEGDPIEDASETDPDGGEGGLGEEGPPAA